MPGKLSLVLPRLSVVDARTRAMNSSLADAGIHDEIETVAFLGELHQWQKLSVLHFPFGEGRGEGF